MSSKDGMSGAMESVAFEKLSTLREYIKSLESMVVAFSGGVDSTFLLEVARDVLDKNVIAVTARSSTYPEREFRETVEFIKKNNIRHIVITSEELEVDGFSENPINRCYLCKKELFTRIIKIAKENGFSHVAEGSNFDDLSDYRPGLKAISELCVVSPLREAKLTKDEIRLLSRNMGLNTWNKPAFACLSSRFPYGQTITREKLEMVDKAEQYLLDIGFSQVRVRYHGEVARIELSNDEFVDVLKNDVARKIYEYFSELGFTYTALDLKGYRTGSMNEKIKVI